MWYEMILLNRLTAEIIYLVLLTTITLITGGIL